MRLTCPNCSAQYEIDPEMIPASGRDVQCSNCASTWFQEPEAFADPVEDDPFFESEEDDALSGSGLDEEAARFFSGEGTDEEDGWLSGEEPEDAADEEDQARLLKAQFEMRKRLPGDEPAQASHETVSPEPEIYDDDDLSDGKERVGLSGTEEAQEDLEDAPSRIGISIDDADDDRDIPESHESPPESTGPDESQARPADDDGATTTEDADAAAPEVSEPDVADDDDGRDEDVPDAARRRLDPNILGILRAEAEREIAARRAEAGDGIELQSDLGLDEAPSAIPVPSEAEIRTARLRGREDDAEEEERRRGLLPDIDDVNATLTAMQDRGENVPPSVLLEEYRARRTGFRIGFSAVMAVVAGVILLYVFAPELARLIPSIEPALAGYVDWANSMRLALDDIMARSVDGLMGLSGNAS